MSQVPVTTHSIMPQFIIRNATSSDLPALSDLLIATWHDTYDGIYGAERVTDITNRWHSVPALERGLNVSGSQFLLAEVDGKIAATAYARRGEGGVVKLDRLYVAPDQQGLGLGFKLLSAVIDAYPNATYLELEVEPRNAGARAFYERQGFAVTGHGQDCGGQGDGIEHLIMTREL